MYFAWFLYIALILGLYFLSRIIVKYYIDPAESYNFAINSICLSFTVSMICILMVPIDVFVTSHPNDVISTLHQPINKYFIREVFIYLYIGLLFITFVILPFNYFYSEERALNYDNDFDLDLSEKRLSSKIIRSAKQTVYFIGFICVLLISGLVFNPEVNYSTSEKLEWVKTMFDVDHLGEQAISFCISIILTFGFCLWVIYGSYGLTALPFQLIKGARSLEEEKSQVDNDLAKLREKYRAIQEKYQKSSSKISKGDQKALTNLKRKERFLNLKNEKIIELETQTKSLQTIFKIISPFRIIIGMICLCFSVLIFSSLAITTYDKITNSSCGFKCGYLIQEKTFLNPIDTLYVYSSYYFPLDYLFFFIFTLYIFICTLYGIIKCGIIFLKGFEIKKEQTQPSSLFIVAAILNISILVVCNQLMTLCPQYATFGNQHYYDIRTRQQSLCTLEAVSKVEAKFICQMTNLSTFYNKISLGYPMFAVIFFLANASFLGLSSLMIFIFMCKKKASQIDVNEDDELDDESKSLINI
ncbi:unnamed protein product [Paramecium octaurelia]|uniref:Lysosomal cobalamin transporter n=1 Tax=Paramecium octaurelia TaxID=43137 RepID=A0A8S1SW63_PAROT|nr:unnamed protein product [Paramecium octaurelia]